MPRSTLRPNRTARWTGPLSRSAPSAPDALLRGALAGAAGTTALNTATYLDMVLRGRGSSSTPQQTVKAAADEVGADIPGDEDTRANRVSGLGPLLGVATGVGTGVLLAALHRRWEPSLLVDAGVATVTAVVGANVPMAALGVSDPRSWSASSWAADLVPHAVYGLTTSLALRLMR